MRKRQRFKRFQEEVMEESDSEEVQEHEEEETLEDLEKGMEIKELSRLYIKAYKREMGREKLNRKIIGFWYNYAEKFKERIEEIQNEDSLVAPRTAIHRIYEEINAEIPEWSRENLKKKTEGARKIYYLFSKIGKTKIKKIKETSMDTILKGTWEEIYELEREYFQKEAEKENDRFGIIEEKRNLLLITGTTTSIGNQE
jgi:ribosomal protein L15